MMKKRYMIKDGNERESLLFLLLFLFCWTGALSQSASAGLTVKRQKEVRPAYLKIASGWNISNFRDFATSPLTYSGHPLYTSLSHIDMNEKRASHTTLSYANGKYQKNFNKNISESKVTTFSLNYLELYQLKKLSSSRVNVKIGGQFNATVNHRENSDLFNNSEGIDIIPTLFAAAKVTLDLSRSGDKSSKYPFSDTNADKRIRTLSYGINVGVVNGSFRNGFAYTSPSAPLNEDDFFAGYEFRIFKGARLNTALDYTIFLNDKNAIQFSYIWDAYRTGGHRNDFEMAAHIVNISLLFGLK